MIWIFCEILNFDISNTVIRVDLQMLGFANACSKIKVITCIVSIREAHQNSTCKEFDVRLHVLGSG